MVGLLMALWEWQTPRRRAPAPVQDTIDATVESESPRRSRDDLRSYLAQRKPDALPRDSSPDAYLEWLGNVGHDPEWIADDYADLCRFMGWAVPDQVAAPRRRSPPAATPTPIAEPAPVFEAVSPDDTPPAAIDDNPAPAANLDAIPRRTSLQAAAAAERFLEWLRVMGHTGQITAADLDTLYLRHCEDQDLIPLAVETLKCSLRKLPGVERGKVESRSKKSNNRRRPTIWQITTLETVTSDEAPWDLPARRAA